MRTLLIGAMAATMVACSCPPLPRQVSLQGCTDADGLTCLDGIASTQPAEYAPASLNANVMTAKTRVAAKAERRSSAHARDKAHAAADTAKPSTVAAESEPSAVANSELSASRQPAETSDAIIARAKMTVAAKMETPASAEFDDMNRAMRKNTFGQFIDTICGRVKGKKASGEDTGDRPFLYLVKDDEAYVVDGPTGSAAATAAYHNICN